MTNGKKNNFLFKILESKIKDFTLNRNSRVEAYIFWVKEKTKVYYETKTTYDKIMLPILVFYIKFSFYLIFMSVKYFGRYKIDINIKYICKMGKL